MTTVEWLYNNLKSHFEHDGDLLEVVQFSFDKAKEMEREQIENAYAQALANERDCDLGMRELCSAHTYYEKTYIK